MSKIKKPSVFWKIYGILTAVLLVALFIWLAFLYSWLGDFEASQPKYVAEDTFNEYFADFDAMEYVSKCYDESLFVETKEHIAEYLENLTANKKITYKKVSSGMDDCYKYIVVAGEEEVKFASFFIVEDKENTGKFKNYRADGFEIFTSNSSVITIEVPKGYSVILNGKELSDSFISEDDIATPSCDHMPEGVTGLLYTKYTVKGLLSVPVVAVTDNNGDTAKIDISDKNYKAEPVYDTSLSDEYTDWILEGVEKYAKYSQYDSKVNVTGFNQVAPYFDPSSDLYESIKTMDNMFVIHYDKFEFTDMSASEFFRYDENTFSCRVQYTQKLYKGKDVYDDFVDQTLYLRNVDGKFLIYDMKVN